jgi:hypothetical protein
MRISFGSCHDLSTRIQTKIRLSGERAEHFHSGHAGLWAKTIASGAKLYTGPDYCYFSRALTQSEHNKGNWKNDRCY